MSGIKRQRFAPAGSLALDPRAFGSIFDLFDEPEEKKPGLTDNGVAVVTIRGPLMHRKEWWFDSYDAIEERVAEALALEPRMVVLSIDSPGGLVSGAFDTARKLRSMAAEAGIDLYAHIEGVGASAGYALASAAMWIGATDSARIGSIGVIDTFADVTEQNRMMGLNVQLVTSGERKADGNPNQAISEDTLNVAQESVDKLANIFFELVSGHGWGGSVENLRAMQARIVHGEDAVRLGLITEIATLDQTIAFASPPELRSGDEAKTEGRYTMRTPLEDAKASLRKAADGDDEEEAKSAKAALKALGEDDGDDGEKDDDAKGEGDDDKDDDAKSEDDDAKSEDDDDKDDADAKATDDDADAKAEGDDKEDAKSAHAIAAKALAEVHTMKADARKKDVADERKSLLASRSDFSPELVKVLKEAPIATVRATCKTLPKGTTRKENVAAAAAATGLQGEGQGNGTVSQLPPEEKFALDARMGLTDLSRKTVNTTHKMSFGVTVPTVKEGK